MLVLNMNMKRQRRPNVRLGEIGDVSAALSSGFPHVSRESFVQKRCKNGSMNTVETLNMLGWDLSEKNSELTISDPGVSPQNSTDSQQNRENKNPNSSRAVGFTSEVEFEKGFSTLDFGNITRKCRAMKRRGHGIKGNNGVYCSAWGSKLRPTFSGQEGKNYSHEYCNDDGLKDLSDHETQAMSKEASENDIYGSSDSFRRDGEFDNNWNEDTGLEGNETTKYGCAWDEAIESDTSSVRIWLEELGFGKYANIFEMHEVDEEALPLLTIDDLKEMGVCAVGPRRKLYNAIQHLRGEDVSTRPW